MTHTCNHVAVLTNSPQSTVAAFEEMQAEASKVGLDMQIASSYRDFNRQLLIWNAKWTGQREVLDINEQPVDMSRLSDEKKLHAVLLWSALPGASRHHWGTDLDVYDKKAVDATGQPLQLTQREYSAGGPCHGLAIWLEHHANEFGFTLPYAKYKGGVAAEPWHISHADPSAKLVEQSILKEQIESCNIEGKTVILNNLEEIISRYTYNRGVR